MSAVETLIGPPPGGPGRTRRPPRSVGTLAAHVRSRTTHARPARPSARPSSGASMSRSRQATRASTSSGAKAEAALVGCRDLAEGREVAHDERPLHGHGLEGLEGRDVAGRPLVAARDDEGVEGGVVRRHLGVGHGAGEDDAARAAGVRPARCLELPVGACRRPRSGRSRRGRGTAAGRPPR